MKNPHDARHKKRQRLVKELFKESFYDQPISAKALDIFSQINFLNKNIQKAAPQFPIEKINKIDLAVLRLAVYELLIEKKQPPKVIVDEAIELAKEYGGETSPMFVNGVLGNIIQNIYEKTSQI